MNRPMNDPRLVIVGAGVAGLAAGRYAARSGYSTTILEMHDLPGGLCTSWRRKGYLFDGSVAGLAGTSPEMPIYRLWQDLGVIGSCPLYDTEDFGSVRPSAPRAGSLTVYTNVGRLETEFLAAFPADAAAVARVLLRRQSLPPHRDPVPHGRWSSSGADDAPLAAGVAARVAGAAQVRARHPARVHAQAHRPLLRHGLQHLVHFGGPDVPLLTVLLPLAYADRRAAGIPLHGWLSFAQAMERRFVQLGGEVRYRSRVVGLTTADGHVTGVRLAGGDVVAAERVLSAADGRFTHGVLLGEPEREVDALYDSRHLSDQPVQVNLGVARDWTSGAVTYLLPGRPSVAGQRQSRLTVHSKHDHPDAAPPGKSALTAFLESRYDFWQALAADRPAYEAEKRRCADLVIAAAERHRPGLAASVEVVDVSTPLTRERYTGNWMGAMQARRPDAGMIRSLLQGGPRYDHPGLAGFGMAGQWVESWGGITTAAQSGRNAVRALCRKDGARFSDQRAVTVVALGVHLGVEVELLVPRLLPRPRVDQGHDHLAGHRERRLVRPGDGLEREPAARGDVGDGERQDLAQPLEEHAGLGERAAVDRRGAAETDAAHPGPAHLFGEETHAAQLGTPLDGLGEAGVGDAVEEWRVPVQLRAPLPHVLEQALGDGRQLVQVARRYQNDRVRSCQLLQRLAGGFRTGAPLRHTPQVGPWPARPSCACSSRAMAPVLDFGLSAAVDDKNVHDALPATAATTFSSSARTPDPSPTTNAAAAWGRVDVQGQAADEEAERVRLGRDGGAIRPRAFRTSPTPTSAGRSYRPRKCISPSRIT